MIQKRKRKPQATNYKRGRQAEYKYVDKLKSEGYSAVRTAGSHGVFDVIGVNEKEIILVQVKRCKKLYPSLYEVDRLKMKYLDVPSNVRKLCVVWIDKIGWQTLYES